MKVYILYEIEEYVDEYEHMVGVFASNELADKYIENSFSWKDDFFKKFGIKYDDVYNTLGTDDDAMTSEMQDWLDENDIRYLTRYFINEHDVIGL